MSTSAASSVGCPGQRSEAVGRSRPDSSIGTSTGRSCTRPSSKSSVPAPGAMWTMPVPSSSDTSSHGMTRCSIALLGRRGRRRGRGRGVRRAPRPARRRATKSAPGRCTAAYQSPSAMRPYSASGRTAAATFAGSVHGVVVQTTSDSPSASASGKRDVERRVVELLVLAGEDLVLGDRRAAARAPLRRPMPCVEPAALVDDLEEAPDVLDVRVGEGVVVVVPVHPPAEAHGLLGDDARRTPPLAPCSALRTRRGRTPRSRASS